MIEKIIMRDGKAIFVRVIGKGEPVVLLHGFAMKASLWVPLILPFIRNYQFILPDFRGFGLSHLTPINNSCVFTNYYEDFEDILDFYKIDRVALGGISMGSYVSLFYLTQKGTSRVNKFLSIDQSPSFKNTKNFKFGLGLTNHEVWMSDFQNVMTLLENYLDEQNFFSLPDDERNYATLKFAKFISASFPSLLTKYSIRTMMKIPYIQNIFLPENWASYFRVLKNYMNNDYDLVDHIHKIDIPTTIMVGMLSEMYPYESALYLHNQIKNSKLVKFEKSGHAIMASEPIKFMIELHRFLKL
ncbi:peroxidase [Candidatus Magnetomorum sp. HK-1]|nr:peroxidase [Candidatus Magnetomorum sp. HK-1]